MSNITTLVQTSIDDISPILKEGGIFNIRSVIALVLVCTGIFTVNYVKKSE